MATTVWDLPAAPWAVIAVVVVVGGVVRGFGGFGASMVWVTGISLVLPPSSAVPTAMLLEVLASLQLLPQVWRDADWRSLRWLLAGYVVGLPVGTWALVSVPARPMKLAIAVVILAAAVVLAAGWHRQDLPGRAGTSGTGVVSGMLNGAFAMGGPPAIAMYFSSPAHTVVGRASLIMFFLCTDVLGTASSAVGGLVTTALLAQVAVLFPVSVVGIAVGSCWYRRTEAAGVRRYVLWLLVALALGTLVQALLP